MNSLADAWKNEEVFKDQYELNLYELDHYPNHWNIFISTVSALRPTIQSVLDVGCGAGIFYELCRRHFPHIKYTGVDYAEEAIKLASEKWDHPEFYVRDYRDLTTEDAEQYDLLHAGAMLDVLPNGDEALEHLVSLGFKHLLLGRVKLTDKASYSEEYIAYDKIRTVAYYHNIDSFRDICEQAGYATMIMPSPDTILLKKND